MNMVEIERALRELRLSGMAQTLPTRLMQAQAAQEPFLQTFAAMLQDELDRRRTRLMERRYKRSGLDEKVGLADFQLRLAVEERVIQLRPGHHVARGEGPLAVAFQCAELRRRAPYRHGRRLAGGDGEEAEERGERSHFRRFA